MPPAKRTSDPGFSRLVRSSIFSPSVLRGPTSTPIYHPSLGQERPSEAEAQGQYCQSEMVATKPKPGKGDQRPGGQTEGQQGEFGYTSSRPCGTRVEQQPRFAGTPVFTWVSAWRRGRRRSAGSLKGEQARPATSLLSGGVPVTHTRAAPACSGGWGQ